MDLVFAVNAAPRDSVRMFKKIKDIIKAIIDKYGTERVHYGLVVYGDIALVKVCLYTQEEVPLRSDTDLHNALAAKTSTAL